MIKGKMKTYIDELFSSNLSEEAVLEKLGISKETLGRWMRNQEFTGEIESRMNRMQFAGRLLIARASPQAAKTLIALTGSDKEETSRKACLDVLGFDTQDCKDQPASASELSPEKAEQILKILSQ